ncbi:MULTISPECIES: DUF3977 family protein [unclassified Paenibacillus]|uniref:DUF3977 family protein n=1 Tax=unclassified Paenibacillus TaxID=185978 RepID=UPI002405FE0A|nr:MULTISPECIES: DUF3977 family protein [unclassified Paenibacillus]MDF9839178.1 hypothetical protein [Paenibacillus sp. PastF-2]MDF9845760.1 hypothetical protein [Paenibacillus sp. PastM-2]MDF9852332.1 hypothetical protein [Paenibacillus sp. PastF-1]MDH6477938.1 hypothetical protein [Paenibacillus sp. PastH-2]MDH6505676.1 hypothetical protein [Paenibacillus sp. PastM-3]
MKYIEFGLGNRWLIRTETELADGTEFEERGIIGPVKLHSAYLRCWAGRTVYIFDVRSGFKRTRKSRKASKLIFGIGSFID